MIDPKLIELGKELIALAEKYSEPRTIKIQPESDRKSVSTEYLEKFIKKEEPCKHEPIEYDLNLIAEAGHYDPKLGAYDLKRTTQSKSFVFGSECKHCGVKLRAEKWVECESIW